MDDREKLVEAFRTVLNMARSELHREEENAYGYRHPSAKRELMLSRRAIKSVENYLENEELI